MSVQSIATPVSLVDQKYTHSDLHLKGQAILYYISIHRGGIECTAHSEKKKHRHTHSHSHSHTDEICTENTLASQTPRSVTL